MILDINIQSEQLDIEKCIDKVRSNSAGAINTFIGTTRDMHEGKKVETLYYEAYEPMALKSLKSLSETAHEKYHEIHGISIHHRVGECPVGDVSVVICVSATHRRDAIHATEFLIDQLKMHTPIWKKEIYSDGKYEWKENCKCTHNPVGTV